jgi:hypothetical protein
VSNGPARTSTRTDEVPVNLVRVANFGGGGSALISRKGDRGTGPAAYDDPDRDDKMLLKFRLAGEGKFRWG